MPETIDVLCFVFPDGSTYFMPADNPDGVHAHRVMAVWKEGLSPETRKTYEDAQLMGGFVWMHMLKADYDKLPATQLSYDINRRMEVLTVDDGSGSIERHENSTDWGGEG